MITSNKECCPLSEDFFYWPPEEISQYTNWCEVGNIQHKRRLKKVERSKKQILSDSMNKSN
ncbi:MAG: hypothetical protein OQL19_05520 [Gammaproteobacteria bacterium]|nr:hypothetical protein [Gammaproteobacteria bacterium]